MDINGRLRLAEGLLVATAHSALVRVTVLGITHDVEGVPRGVRLGAELNDAQLVYLDLSGPNARLLIAEISALIDPPAPRRPHYTDPAPAASVAELDFTDTDTDTDGSAS